MQRFAVAAFGCAVALAALAAPAIASAASGYMTCQGYQSQPKRVLYTRAFAAESGTENAVFAQFIAALMGDGYVSDLAQFQGICNWEKSAREAENKTDNFKKHYVSEGAGSMGVGFEPKAVTASAAAAPAPKGPAEDLDKVRAAAAAKTAFAWCSLTDFDNRKVYFSDLFSYSGELGRHAEFQAAFMADLVKTYRKVSGDPVCHMTYSEEYERDARQKAIDGYKGMATVTRSKWTMK